MATAMVASAAALAHACNSRAAYPAKLFELINASSTASTNLAGVINSGAVNAGELIKQVLLEPRWGVFNLDTVPTGLSWMEGTTDTDARAGLIAGVMSVKFTGTATSFQVWQLDEFENKLSKLADCSWDDSYGGQNRCTIGAPLGGSRIIQPEC
jgi:hypothetical protein